MKIIDMYSLEYSNTQNNTFNRELYKIIHVQAN